MTFQVFTLVALLSGLLAQAQVEPKPPTPSVGDFKRSQSLELAQAHASRQAILYLSATPGKALIRQKIPQGLKIVDQTSSFLVVRGHDPISEELLKTLKTLPGVVDARLDGVTMHNDEQAPPAEVDPAKCPPKTDITGAATAADQLDKIKAAIPPPVCPLFDVCPGSERTRLWAQQRVDADLMQDELQRLGVKPGHTRVAVIDTGFDTRGNSANMTGGTIAVKKGFPEAGPPGHDEEGHGTMVAGLIGGSNGVGVAPDVKLTMYRDRAPGQGSGGSIAQSLAAIDRACDDGNEIINVSTGGALFGIAWLEVPLLSPNTNPADHDFVARLAARGCLVVNSAGNMGGDFRKQTFNPDDALMTVEASEDNRSRSSFSSRGEVIAPGDSVFTLQSDEMKKDKVDKNSLCGQNPGAFVSGTSFSSPIAAGLTAEVLGVLKTGKRFGTLSKPQRITLLNRIMAASQTEGSLNGLKAVLLAERWNEIPDASRAVATTDELKLLLAISPPDFCSSPRQKCSELTDCKDVKPCFQAARKIVRMCQPADPAAIGDVLKLSLASGDLQYASYWIRVLGQSPQSSGKVLADAAVTVWNSYITRWSKGDYGAALNLSSHLDFDLALDILPSYIETVPDSGAAIAAFFSSFRAMSRLREAPSPTSTLDTARAKNIFLSYLTAHGHDETLKLISERVAKSEKTLSYDEVAVNTRLLAALIDDPAMKDLKDELTALESGLYSKLNEANPMMGLTTPEQIAILSPMMERNKEALAKSAADGLEQGSLGKLGPYQVAYLMQSPQTIAPDITREQVALATLKTMAQSGGWQAYDDTELTKLALESIRKQFEHAAPKDKAATRAELEKIMEHASNVDLVTAVLAWPQGNFEKPKGADEIISPAFEVRLARKAALSITNQTPSETNDRMGDELILLRHALPVLLKDNSGGRPAPQQIDAFIYNNGYHSDRRAPPAAPAARTMENKSTAGTLDALATWALHDVFDAFSGTRDYRINGSRRSYASMVLKMLIGDANVRKKLPANGSWRKALSEFKADLASDPHKYGVDFLSLDTALK